LLESTVSWYVQTPFAKDIDICYWPDRSKEGQFLLGFGKQRGAKESAISLRQEE